MVVYAFIVPAPVPCVRIPGVVSGFEIQFACIVSGFEIQFVCIVNGSEIQSTYRYNVENLITCH